MIITITDIQKNNPDGIVMAIHWTAVEAGTTISGVYRTQFKNPDSTDFIKFENLTEDKALSWLGPADIEGLMSTAKDLESTISYGLPW